MTSALQYILDNQMTLDRWIRSKPRADWEFLSKTLMLSENHKITKAIIEDHKLKDGLKYADILDHIMNSRVCIVGILGGQFMGKDTLRNRIAQDVYDLTNKKASFVTLGDFKTPPFAEGRYFRLGKIPRGTPERPKYILISELDTVFNARVGQSADNLELVYQLQTLRQNHQKIIGCCKMAYNVDVSFWRACTMKLYKYINSENLKHERIDFLSPLGDYLRPKDPTNKRQVLAVYDDKYRTFEYDMPEWHDEELSEQFSGITEEEMFDCVISLLEKNKNLQQIREMLLTRYRFDRPIEWYTRNFSKYVTK